MRIVRILQIYDLNHPSPRQSANLAVLMDGVLFPGANVADMLPGRRIEFARDFGHEPTTAELFDYLTQWTNGYAVGRELPVPSG